MSKIFVSGDWHVAFDRPETEYERERIDKITNQLQTIMVDDTITEGIFLGDFPKGKRRITYQGVNRLLKTAVHYFKYPSVHFIEGNHDVSEERSLFEAFHAIAPDFAFVEGNECRFIPRKTGVGWLMIPYRAGIEGIKKALQVAIDAGKKFYVFGHFGVRGAQFNPGSDFVALEGVHPSTFDHELIQHVYLGHYHTRQTIGKVTYVGSPWQVTFGEEGAEKFVLILHEDEKGILTEEWVSTGCDDLITIDVSEKPTKERYHRIRYKTDTEKRKFLEKYQDIKIVRWIRVNDEDEVDEDLGLETDDFISSPEDVVQTFGKEEGLTNEEIDVGLKIMKKAMGKQ